MKAIRRKNVVVMQLRNVISCIKHYWTLCGDNAWRHWVVTWLVLYHCQAGQGARTTQDTGHRTCETDEHHPVLVKYHRISQGCCFWSSERLKYKNYLPSFSVTLSTFLSVLWQIWRSSSVVRDHCVGSWLVVTRISKYLTQTDHQCPLAVIVRQAAINLHALSQSNYLPHYWGRICFDISNLQPNGNYRQFEMF